MNKQNTFYLSEKTEYFFIDFAKLICAFLVMAIHIPLFAQSDMNFWFTNTVCRLAVPFYFVAAGFFLASKLHDRERVIAYLRRITLLYLIYTLIYARYIYILYRNEGYTLFTFIKDFFCYGSYTHLWYLLALIIGVVLLYFFVEFLKWSDKKIFVLITVLHTIGVFVNAYRALLAQVPLLDKITQAYETVFYTTRNGIFLGFPYLFIGCFIYKHQHQIKKKSYWLYSILFFALLVLEEYFAKTITNHTGQSMLFTTPFVITSLFLAAAFVRLPKLNPGIGKFIRNLSFLLYALHLFVRYNFGMAFFSVPFLSPEVYAYARVAIRTIVLGTIILLLSKKKHFTWLKYFY